MLQLAACGRLGLLLLATLPTGLCGLYSSPRAAADAVGCDRVASPTGSDRAAGTLARPLRSLRKLTASLRPGQTGCLRGGTWNEGLYVNRPGVTITSFPGERAKVVGLTSIGGDADGATVQDLDLVGKDVSPTVYADGATLRGNDVTNAHRGRTCILLGDSGSAPVRDTRIEGNRIHDCGRLPSTNLDHGIYASSSRGAVITLNLIDGNADWGVHLYPDASGSVVSRNVIDGNGGGVTFGGDDQTRSTDNVVEANVISNPKVQDNLQSYWGPDGNLPGDLGNVARNNCLWGGRASDGGIDLSQVGFTASDNTVADPGFEKGHAVPADSPCRGLTGDPATEAASANAVRTATPIAPITLDPARRVARLGKPLRVNGSAPGTAGRLVQVEMKRGRQWVRVGETRTRPDESFSARVRINRAGGATLRALVPDLGVSRTVSVRVLSG